MELESFFVTDNIPFFDETGNKVFFDKFDGKCVLLVFWATWCAPCVKEIPDLDILQKDFRKLPFEVITVSEDFLNLKAVENFFKAEEIRHLKIYYDLNNQLFKNFNIVSLPTSFIINSEGKVVFKFLGSTNWYDQKTREILLNLIPGNHPMPKITKKESSLNQLVKTVKPEIVVTTDQPAQPKDEKETEKAKTTPKSTITIDEKNHEKTN